VLYVAKYDTALAEPRAQFAAFMYSIYETACGSSQQVMLAISKANKLGGFKDLNASYGERPPFVKPSIRTKRANDSRHSGSEPL